MKALVTGGTGFIGSHLIDRLLEDGHAVGCLVRRSSSRRWLVGRPLELIECDQVCDADLLRDAVRGIDVVFHVLGTLVAPSIEAYREVNVRPVRMVLDACRQVEGLKRFVLMGSQGAAGPNPGLEGRLSETDPCRPVSAYGRSKLEAEEVTREYRGQVPYTILRLSAVYGPRDRSFLKILRSAYRRGVIPQVGRQPKSLSLAHIRDIVECTVRAATVANSLNETYFLASDEPYSFDDIRAACETAMKKPVKVRVIPGLVVQGMMLYADFLSKVCGKDILLNRDRLKTLSYPRWVCDVSKARAHLGCPPTISLNDGVRETFEWYREQGWL